MNKRRGFTLIELLVVIAIIALLMSILMPALSKVRKQALSVVCRARLKQWGVILSMYTGENDGFMHKRSIGATTGYQKMWPYVYKKRYQDPKMRFCPTAENVTRVTGMFATWDYEGMGQFSPTYDTPNCLMPGESELDYRTNTVVEGYFTGSFGMNRLVEDMQGGAEGTSPYYWRKVDVKGADKVPVLMDCIYLYYNPSTASPPATPGDWTSNDMKKICVDRHMGYINVCYLDFSARKTGLKEIWTLKHDRNYDTCNDYTICKGGGGKIGKSAAHQIWHDNAPWMDKYPEY